MKYDTKTIVSNIDRLNNQIDHIYFVKMTNDNISDEKYEEYYEQIRKLKKQKRNWELKL